MSVNIVDEQLSIKQTGRPLLARLVMAIESGFNHLSTTQHDSDAISACAVLAVKF